jgi:hypothetical protein
MTCFVIVIIRMILLDFFSVGYMMFIGSPFEIGEA